MAKAKKVALTEVKLKVSRGSAGVTQLAGEVVECSVHEAWRMIKADQAEATNKTRSEKPPEVVAAEKEAAKLAAEAKEREAAEAKERAAKTENTSATGGRETTSAAGSGD